MIIEGTGLILTTSETDQELLFSLNNRSTKERTSLMVKVERANEADITCARPPPPGLNSSGTKTFDPFANLGAVGIGGGLVRHVKSIGIIRMIK